MIKNSIYITIVLLLIGHCVYCTNFHTNNALQVNKIELVKVHDGDTFTVNISNFPPIIGQKIPIRINSIDCPELRDPKHKTLALKAKDFTKNKLESCQKIELRNLKRDKYFRILADVYVDNQNLGKMLLSNKLAKPYFGKTKQW